MKKEIPIHETLGIGSLLAIAAGGLDAYSYLVHGEVFAGLQTGNLILLGIHLLGKNQGQISHYLTAITAFALGTIISRIIQRRFNEFSFAGARQLFVIVWEISFMVFVALFSNVLPDALASALLSIAAAAQLQEFRRLKDGAFTSLMMTGNLRQLAASFVDGFLYHNAKAREQVRDTFVIIMSFVLGAAATSCLVTYLHGAAILFSSSLLLLALLIIFTQAKKAVRA
ncbi:YoaK family protein [Enterococcus sp. CSURQ0835]|uniref:YoaK family protein n=1 Tax=Enterococcus sp. CSURQ0835 TaxID=2681394 RepID=UPI001358AEED|nr:YoaK family protein [Enterococcus sp. CSURQ0835]